MSQFARCLATVVGLVLAAGCRSLPSEPPPLLDMEEPLAWFEEPDDEDARQALPKGSFSGVYVRSAADTLEAVFGEGGGIVVDRVIENSPGERAGLEEGDLILEVQEEGQAPLELQYPSEWRELEVEAQPGSKVRVVYDRANRERETELILVERVKTAPREESERIREEQRAGVVVRTATEVEARGGGLGPGGGAVVVGMAHSSPWRAAGIGYGDLIVAIDGERIVDPRVLLTVLQAVEEDQVELEIVRNGERLTVDAPLTTRAQELQTFWIPLLFSYESSRKDTSTNALLWLFQYDSTPAAWEMTLFWFITFGGGDSDVLVEVDG